MQPLMDHYKILELQPPVTLDDVKKAYRKMAQKYHPDKNGDDPYARAYFYAVKEAYETLTDPHKKQEYLQQRWYEKSTGRKPEATIITPEYILQQFIKLEKNAGGMEMAPHQAKEISSRIQQLLTSDIIERLNDFNERQINDTIGDLILRITVRMPWPVINEATAPLSKLQVSSRIRSSVDKQTSGALQDYRWSKFRVAGILLVTALVSLLIWLVASV
ncbi:J domain-containing protein [Terrimonas ferruginea]|uniref:J domain-containing protein n=1 Tax=Terrimonas ferruginea TaxID=249 RepID=UPI00041C0EF1|nr:J domain-containing protein [Terrimonas ferruginea]